MRKALVAGNWKMHGRIEQNQLLVETLVAQLTDLADAIDIVICPPLVYLDQVGKMLNPDVIQLGAQDVSRFGQDGAHTGDCSAAMLADLGVRYVLVGHSERRSDYAENDQCIATKLAQVLSVGLTPILCVGEILEQREAQQVEQVIASQLIEALEGLDSHAVSSLVLAYEPVWAIGTGKTATPEQAQAVHAFIRETLASRYGQPLADRMIILYGGSVKAANAEQLFGQADIDGGLIGGAALVSEEFTAICRAAANSTIDG
ncbi:Triosephosphate isomerase [Nitrincola lacisaponensis]|uniref:Triosephosphate isomerase n=1 Tax=Nitrincola lacisaponensis TaxID=267850 RepID=A0A063Y2H0_9GAMM|nr:triose-phosphate isomerase [Nitrincola lacisaponensis]KDE38732.1 Triosephosphate isomerase [Nitrincola lacisaponensis]